jgi:hypothetical protein
MDANEFYRLRDDRTNVCVGAAPYASKKVAISIDAAAARTLAGQVAFVLAINLTSRWCRTLRVIAPPEGVHERLTFIAPGVASVGDLALTIAQAADPFGDFRFGPPDDETSLCLHVGATPSIADAFRIGARGWTALCSDEVHDDALALTDGAGGVIAASLAACIGVGCVFRRAIGDLSVPSSVRLSAWNLRGGLAASDGPTSIETDVGRLLLVGAGAVGSAIAWLLPLAGVRADVTVVDRDLVEVSNLNRSPLFSFADVALAKVKQTAEYLRRAGLNADAVPAWFDEAVEAQQIFAVRPDVVVPAANEREVRQLVQHAVPPLQVYGTTGGNWQAFLGRHIPLVEDCLACRFPPQRSDQPALACATGNIDAPEAAQPRDAALPFLSAAAAVFAVAELLKLRNGPPANPNFAVLDFRGPLQDFFIEQRPARDDCFCRTQRPVWHKLNAGTLFARQR